MGKSISECQKWRFRANNNLDHNHLKSNIMNSKKQSYTAPQIESIELDNEIALQLESTPPKAPGEAKLNAPEYFDNDPFKTSQA